MLCIAFGRQLAANTIIMIRYDMAIFLPSKSALQHRHNCISPPEQINHTDYQRGKCLVSSSTIPLSFPHVHYCCRR